jgi:transcriptional regulator with XRE-family HTH domain
MAIKNPCAHLRATREKLGLTQAQFWNRIGVTQSAGSRIESKGKMLPAYAMLIEIAYGTAGDCVIIALRACTTSR